MLRKISLISSFAKAFLYYNLSGFSSRGRGAVLGGGSPTEKRFHFLSSKETELRKIFWGNAGECGTRSEHLSNEFP